MKTSKHILLTLVFVLLSGLGAGVMAQNRVSEAFRLPPEPIPPVTKVSAIEVADGVVGYHGETREETVFGYSFLGRTTGDFPGSFSLSMNCAPAIAMGEGKGEMTGGSWTLPVYPTALRGSAYLGALYGTVAKGTITWDGKGTSATIYLVLNVDGGTQTYEGVSGYATFAGTLLVDEKTDTTTLTGDMVFNIMTIQPIQ